jgi:hypothetical protein
MLEEGDRVVVINYREEYECRPAVVTGLHLKDVSIRFEDNNDGISVRYRQVKLIQQTADIE